MDRRVKIIGIIFLCFVMAGLFFVQPITAQLIPFGFWKNGGGGTCTCNSAADCAAKLRGNSCASVNLTQDISGHISFRNNNKTFDCRNFTVTDGSIQAFGNSNTVKNCKIPYKVSQPALIIDGDNNSLLNNQVNGISIWGNSCLVDRNTVSYHLGVKGIYVGRSSSATITNNIVDGMSGAAASDGIDGIQLNEASNAVVNNNTVKGGWRVGLGFSYSPGTTANGNSVCGNTSDDIMTWDGTGTGDNNKCTKNTLGLPWKDDGASGCTNQCP